MLTNIPKAGECVVVITCASQGNNEEQLLAIIFRLHLISIPPQPLNY